MNEDKISTTNEIRPFEVAYVDRLPMVNTTGKFLVAKAAGDDFGAVLKDFLPFFLKHYVICGIKHNASQFPIIAQKVSGFALSFSRLSQ